MRRLADHFPSHVLAQVKTSQDALKLALYDWQMQFPDRSEPCPLLRLWLDQEIERIERIKSLKKESKSLALAYPGRLAEITEQYLNRYESHLPRTRRPSLSWYDNRRDRQHGPKDRYYFGIWGSKND